MTKKIIFTTLRNNKGATGGPGGVLFLQMTTLGNERNGIPCEYHFNKLHMRLGERFFEKVLKDVTRAGKPLGDIGCPVFTVSPIIYRTAC